jgi:DNA mismatch repair ATPase MutS
MEEIIENYKKSENALGKKQVWMSAHMTPIYKAHKALSKLRSLEKICTKLFSNISEAEDIGPILQKIQNYQQKLKGALEDSVQKWQDACQECIDEIENQIDHNLLDLDHDNGVMTVNYSDTLIGFVRELRQLNELGVGGLVAQNIVKTVNDQKKGYREAIQ